MEVQELLSLLMAPLSLPIPCSWKELTQEQKCLLDRPQLPQWGFWGPH